MFCVSHVWMGTIQDTCHVTKNHLCLNIPTMILSFRELPKLLDLVTDGNSASVLLTSIFAQIISWATNALLLIMWVNH